MSEQEKKILDTISGVLPSLSEMDRERLLAFGEGMAFKAGMEKTNRAQDSNT